MSKKLVPIQVVILEGGLPIGGWIGMVADPHAITTTVGNGATVRNLPHPTDVTPTPKNVEMLARKTGTYTKPRPHMQHLWQDLERHTAAVAWINERVSAATTLQVYKQSLAIVWWDWFDDKLKPTDVSRHLDRIEGSSRLAYGQWLMDQFIAHGSKGRDARYTLRMAISSYKRGELKLKTFDTKLNVATERLRILRSK